MNTENHEEAGETTQSIDESKFVDSALNFPCFADARDGHTDHRQTFATIMTAYRDDNLTEDQDLVVELLFHMQHEETPFNLKRAVELWSEDDLAALWKLLLEQSGHDD